LHLCLFKHLAPIHCEAEKGEQTYPARRMDTTACFNKPAKAYVLQHSSDRRNKEIRYGLTAMPV
jgi:hypothetical protein